MFLLGGFEGGLVCKVFVRLVWELEFELGFDYVILI